MDPSFTAKCAVVAVKGERERGNGGAVYYNESTNEIGYLLIPEIEPQELQENVSDLLNDESFVVLYKTEKEVHITKMLKMFAFQLFTDMQQKE